MKATKLRKLLALTSAVAMLLSGLSTTALASTSDTGNEVFYNSHYPFVPTVKDV